MTMTKAIKRALASVGACLTLSISLAEPTISDVVIRQRWPWSRLVDITYRLDGDPTQCVDVAVNAYNGSEKLSFPLNALSGDLYCVSNGTRRMMWDPLKAGYTNTIFPRFCVDLSPTAVPLYMIVDLTKKAGTTNQIEYVYESDLVTNKWGTWERDVVPNVTSVIWTGVTNNEAYKTDKLVLRRVRAVTFKMGDAASPTIPVTLTKDFYVGVFEVTEAQWFRIMGGTAVVPTRPKAQVSYEDIRGPTNRVPRVDWYTTGYTVSPTNFLGLLRGRTGIDGFDLPTEAQWECMCRAGTISYYNDGVSTVADDTILNRLGWWNASFSYPVGQKAANAWGLYDTLGNLEEWCLDWHASLSGGTNPMGAVSGTYRVIRSGSFNDRNASLLRCGYRDYLRPLTSQYTVIGFRLVVALP